MPRALNVYLSLGGIVYSHLGDSGRLHGGGDTRTGPWRLYRIKVGLQGEEVVAFKPGKVKNQYGGSCELGSSESCSYPCVEKQKLQSGRRPASQWSGVIYYIHLPLWSCFCLSFLWDVYIVAAVLLGTCKFRIITPGF